MALFLELSQKHTPTMRGQTWNLPCGNCCSFAVISSVNDDMSWVVLVFKNGFELNRMCSVIFLPFDSLFGKIPRHRLYVLLPRGSRRG